MEEDIYQYKNYIACVNRFDQRSLEGTNSGIDKLVGINQIIDILPIAKIDYLKYCEKQKVPYDKTYKHDFIHACGELDMSALKFFLWLSMDHSPSIDTLYFCINNLVNRFVGLYVSDKDYVHVRPHFYVLDIAADCLHQYPDEAYIEITEKLLKVGIREDNDLDVLFLFLKRMIIGLFKYDREKIAHIIKMGLEHENQFVQEEIVDLLDNLDYHSRSQ